MSSPNDTSPYANGKALNVIVVGFAAPTARFYLDISFDRLEVLWLA